MNINDVKKAWHTIIQDLDQDCGYEGSELDEPEIAKHVANYQDAWDLLDEYFGAFK